MNVREKIARLRQEMEKEHIDVYIVPSDDAHMSEYVSPHFKCREFLTGFTGSAGTAIVTADFAGLWTDGRYFLQAEEELADTGICLMKIGEDGVVTVKDFLLQQLREGKVVGCDGTCVSGAFVQGLRCESEPVSSDEKESVESVVKAITEDDVREQITDDGKRGSIVTHLDLVDRIWEDRPPMVSHPVWELTLAQSGKSRADKLQWLREELEKKGADGHLLASLTDIAWLLNLRGCDISCVPVFFSYLYVTRERCVLYTDAFKTLASAKGAEVSDDRYASRSLGIQQDATCTASCEATALQIMQNVEPLSRDGMEIKPYADIFTDMPQVAEKSILLHPEEVNAGLTTILEAACQQNGGQVIYDHNPTELAKAIKNPTELANIRAAHIKDGVTVTKFIYKMKQYAKELSQAQEREVNPVATNCAAPDLGTTGMEITQTADQAPMTERSAAALLLSLRQEQPGFLGESFEPIMAYGEHGAIVHYSATEATDSPIGKDSFLLADTGGHYMEGTTDITRTIHMAGEHLTAEKRRHYTLVLKSHLRLLHAIFPKGACGNTIDAIAREPLWEVGLDFNHGTGHGVGYILSVHEGPNAFRTYRGKGEINTTAILPGMVTSNEPGLYFPGEYGIRLENLIECVELPDKPDFYGFSSLTYAPFDREAVDVTELNPQEIAWLDAYQQEVYEKIAPFLSEEEAAWLAEETAPLDIKKT